jgi:hypothetical protein
MPTPGLPESSPESRARLSLLALVTVKVVSCELRITSSTVPRASTSAEQCELQERYRNHCGERDAVAPQLQQFLAQHGNSLHVSGSDAEALEAAIGLYRDRPGLVWQRAVR